MGRGAADEADDRVLEALAREKGLELLSTPLDEMAVLLADRLKENVLIDRQAFWPRLKRLVWDGITSIGFRYPLESGVLHGHSSGASIAFFTYPRTEITCYRPNYSRISGRIKTV
jgi:hypothetical protein